MNGSVTASNDRFRDTARWRYTGNESGACGSTEISRRADYGVPFY
jgi:hypothetical protein